MYPGGYTIEYMPRPNMPSEVEEGFAQTLDNVEGASYMPVLYIGQAVAAGMNYMLICKQTLSDKDQTVHIVKVVLYRSLQNEWSVSEISEIV